MEGIKDQLVRDGGGVELVGERGINEVDKESVRKEGDHFIVSIRSGNVVRMMG